MVPNSIKVGLRAYTRISSDSSTLVEIVEDTREGTKRYRVKRIDTGAILRKLRGPGELHEKPGPWHRAPVSSVPAPVAASPSPPKPGPRLVKATRVATMGAKTQADLLKKLGELPPDTREFIKDLIDACIPSTSTEVRL